MPAWTASSNYSDAERVLPRTTPAACATHCECCRGWCFRVCCRWSSTSPARSSSTSWRVSRRASSSSRTPTTQTQLVTGADLGLGEMIDLGVYRFVDDVGVVVEFKIDGHAAQLRYDPDGDCWHREAEQVKACLGWPAMRIFGSWIR